MARFDPATLDLEDRAFVESLEGVHRSLEALKLVFPAGRYLVALESMQEANALLVAAALKQGPPPG